MARRIFQAVACLLFGFLPLTAVVYAFNGVSLPSRLIARFDSSGMPVAWMAKSRFLGLYMACMLLIAVAGSTTALLTPEDWEPDLTSWFGLIALFAVTGLMVHSEKAILAQRNSPFSDPVVDAVLLTTTAIALAWQLFRWTQL